jgi:hypothetical protein
VKDRRPEYRSWATTLPFQSRKPKAQALYGFESSPRRSGLPRIVQAVTLLYQALYLCGGFHMFPQSSASRCCFLKIALHFAPPIRVASITIYAAHRVVGKHIKLENLPPYDFGQCKPKRRARC